MQPTKTTTTTVTSVRRRTLRWSYLEGALYALMVASSESFAIYYALTRGLTPTQVATLTTLPVLIGSLANWLIPLWIKTTQLKKGIALVVFIQALGLILQFTSVFSGENYYLWILSALTLYWLGGMAASPLWLDWIAPWLPTERLGRYLSRRNAFVSLMTVSSYLLFAYYLHEQGNSTEGYALIFAIGLFARSVSWGALLFQPSPVRKKFSQPSLSLSWKQIFSSKPILIVGVFTGIFKFATMTGTTYFTPFLVNDLKLSLLQYSIIAAIPYLGRAAFLASWGEAIRNFRAYLALEVSMVAISAIALLWSFFPSFGALAAIESCTGIFWAGFELAIVLIFQNFAPGNARALVGLHLAFMNLASLGGAYFGSYLLSFGISNIEIFRISSVLRFAIAGAFILTLARTEGTKKTFRVYSDFLWTVLSLRPALINIGRIVPFSKSGPAIPNDSRR